MTTNTRNGIARSADRGARHVGPADIDCSQGGGTRPVLALRPARERDLVPLTFFFDTLLRRDYFLRRGQLAEILSGQRHATFIAEIDGVLVGAAIVSGEARLINLLVHPAFRGLGVGQALLRCSGAREVRAKIDMSTGDPRAFYAANGFVPTGEFVGRGQIEIMRLQPDRVPLLREQRGAERTSDVDTKGDDPNVSTHARSNGRGNGAGRRNDAARIRAAKDRSTPARGAVPLTLSAAGCAAPVRRAL